MQKIEDAIVEILKSELEYTEVNADYNQWVLAVSIKKDRYKTQFIGSPTYIARVIVKTSESPYVDGMDIIFRVLKEEVIIEANYYENAPDFQGGSVDSSLAWLKVLGNICYFQLSNPYGKEGEADGL